MKNTSIKVNGLIGMRRVMNKKTGAAFFGMLLAAASFSAGVGFNASQTEGSSIPLPIAKGGTGGATAAAARTNLDVYSKADSIKAGFPNYSSETQIMSSVTTTSVTVNITKYGFVSLGSYATTADANCYYSISGKTAYDFRVENQKYRYGRLGLYPVSPGDYIRTAGPNCTYNAWFYDLKVVD